MNGDDLLKPPKEEEPKNKIPEPDSERNRRNKPSINNAL